MLKHWLPWDARRNRMQAATKRPGFIVSVSHTGFDSAGFPFISVPRSFDGEQEVGARTVKSKQGERDKLFFHSFFFVFPPLEATGQFVGSWLANGQDLTPIQRLTV